MRSGAASIRQKTKQAFVGEAGQATVEFAVVLPLLLMLVTGILSFAIAMYDKQELQVAASQGVQEVVLRQHGYDADPCGTATTAIKSATQLNSSLMGITFLNGGPAGTSISGGTCANLPAGTVVSVKLTYPCTMQWIFNFSQTCSLTAFETESVPQ